MAQWRYNQSQAVLRENRICTNMVDMVHTETVINGAANAGQGSNGTSSEATLNVRVGFTI